MSLVPVRERITTLIASGYSDAYIVRALNREGYKNYRGKRYNKGSVYWYRTAQGGAVKPAQTANTTVTLPDNVRVIEQKSDTSVDLMTGIRSVLNLKGVPSENKLKAIASLVS